jgi:hypothetical protein
MADISQLQKPPRKGEPPKPADTMNNLQKPATGANVPLQLKIPTELRRDFRSYAAGHDMDLNKLFEMVWDFYKKNHG